MDNDKRCVPATGLHRRNHLQQSIAQLPLDQLRARATGIGQLALTRISAILLASLLSTYPTLAQDLESALSQCQGEDPQSALAGCTALIGSGKLNNKGVVVALTRRGMAQKELRNFKDAAADFSKALKLSPNDAALLFHRGNAYVQLNEPEKALPDFNKVIKLKPSSANAYFARGTVYFAKHDDQRAISDFSQAIRLNPKDAIAYVSRGQAYYFSQDRVHAIADYQRALEISPGLEEAKEALSKLGVSP